MAKRALTITIDADWQGALRNVARNAFGATTYQGETLSFETAGAFFGKLTHRRWDLLRLLQGAGELSIRELARRAGRDVKRVHEDIGVLSELGLVERTERVGWVSWVSLRSTHPLIAHANQYSLWLSEPVFAQKEQAKAIN